MVDASVKIQEQNEQMLKFLSLEPKGLPGIEELREEQLRLKRRYCRQLIKWESYQYQKKLHEKNACIYCAPPEPPQLLPKAEFISFLEKTVSYFKHFENLEMLHPLLLKEATKKRTEAECILHRLRTAKEDF